MPVRRHARLREVQHLVPEGAFGGDELKLRRHVAAADHADVLGLVGAEDKFVDAGALFGGERFAHILAVTLDRAAADRPGNAPLRAHEHQRALAARRAAAVCNERDEHAIAPRRALGNDLREDRSHDLAPFVVF